MFVTSAVSIKGQRPYDFSFSHAGSKRLAIETEYPGLAYSCLLHAAVVEEKGCHMDVAPGIGAKVRPL